MIGDDELAVAGAVDAVDRTQQADPAPVGQPDRDPVVGAEAHLGREHGGSTPHDQIAVVSQPGEEVVEHAGAFVGPEGGTAGAAAAFGALAHLVEERGERFAVFVGPSGGSGLRQGAVDDGLVEQVERAVVRRSPIAGGDADLVAGLLDRLDVEQVMVEVGVRACRPRFEAARRDRAGERGNGNSGQVAVVRGQRIARAGGEEAQPAQQHDVVGGDRGIGEPVAGGDVPGTASQTMIGGAGREGRRCNSGVVRCDDALIVGPRSDPPRELDRRRRAQVASWCGERDSAGGEGGQQHPVQPNRAGVGGGKPSDGTVGIGEQRVARGSRGQHPLGRTEHDGNVDVESGGACERCRR